MRGPAGRHVRRRRRVQLLSRPRISARSATAARCITGDAALAARVRAAAQRRPDAIATTTSSRASTAGSTRCRRRCCARGCRGCARDTEQRRALAARYRSLLDGAPIAVPAGVRPRPRLSSVSDQSAPARGAAGSSSRVRHRNADALSDAHSAAAGVRVARRRPTARSPRVRPREVLSLPLHPGLAADDRRSASPDGRSKGLIT